jgi:hypothetical protein
MIMIFALHNPNSLPTGRQVQFSICNAMRYAPCALRDVGRVGSRKIERGGWIKYREKRVSVMQ